MTEPIYKAGDQVVIVIVIDHVESQLIDGYPTGEWIAITDRHWRISEKTLQEMERRNDD